MSEDKPQHSPDAAVNERLARLEERMTRIEAQLAPGSGVLAAQGWHDEPSAGVSARPVSAPAHVEEEFEFQVGQNWFAVAGILALAIGAAFMLSLPYASLPAGVPSLGGLMVAAGLFLLARRWERAFELVASYLRGAGMALLFFATLRLYFFGAQHVLSTGSLAGRALLVLVVGFNLAIAWRRKSPWLAGLALVIGYATAVAVGSAGFVLGTMTLLAALVVAASRQANWPRLALVGIPLGYATYFLWAIGNPFLGGAFRFAAEPKFAPAFVLVAATTCATGFLLRPSRETEDAVTCLGALFNCTLGYGLFLVHTAASFAPAFVGAHLLAFVVFLVVANLFWVREHSRVSTFFYAMTGYAALSAAIMKAAAMPEVFVWLSLQSVVVVATAVWFRSRFIVVANFLIYVAIILGYIIVARQETGVSLGFGLVALGSARILNWQKDRLELKTELMRNAYLFSAFIVFPYALYHLVPGRYVGLAWVGLASVYYLLNLVVQNQKYRWMGHTTLLLTTLYQLVVGISRFEPVYRIVSFLVLGTVLLIVSLSFTRWRARQRGDPHAGN
ncbi:MAG: DUF2339 domain-containing protein [Verrucomicrobia bacterium]|nr:DUF2339 domain-containing protein [Verrucomicrobiota bacterium]